MSRKTKNSGLNDSLTYAWRKKDNDGFRKHGMPKNVQFTDIEHPDFSETDYFFRFNDGKKDIMYSRRYYETKEKILIYIGGNIFSDENLITLRF